MLCRTELYSTCDDTLLCKTGYGPHTCSQVFNDRVEKNVLYGKRIASLLHAGNDLDRFDRIATQCKEVFPDADGLTPQHFFVNCYKILLYFGTRRYVFHAGSYAQAFRSG